MHKFTSEEKTAMKASMMEIATKTFGIDIAPAPVTLVSQIKTAISFKGKKSQKVAPIESPEVVATPEVAEVVAPEVIAPEEKVALPEVIAQTEVTEKKAPRWASDMIGQVYAHITVTGWDAFHNGKSFSVARCDCGKEFTANSWMIKFGHKTHCGCQKKKKVVETPLAELTEKLPEDHVILELAEVAAPF